MKEVLKMLKAAIYYRQQEYESIEKSVEIVKKVINKIEKTQNIVGVFMDSFNDRAELFELFNSPMSELDILYIIHSLEDEFDSELIMQLSKTEQFAVKYIEDIP
jgi:hypothetical protein